MPPLCTRSQSCMSFAYATAADDAAAAAADDANAAAAAAATACALVRSSVLPCSMYLRSITYSHLGTKIDSS